MNMGMLRGRAVALNVLVGAVLVLSSGIARAGGPPVRVVFRGRADPALAALIASELAASGYTPEIVLDRAGASASGWSEAGIELEVHLGETEAYAVVHVGPGLSNAAPIPIDDPEAAALGAVSLLLEAPPVRRATPSVSCSDRATALAAPGVDRADAEPPAASDEPHRGAVVEVAGSTAFVANGVSVALGVFIGRDWLAELHGRALHLWPTDTVLTLASGSLAYVARVADVDLEAGLEAGIITLHGAPNRVTTGAQLGGFAGLAIHADPSAAVLVRLSLLAAEIEGAWLPGGLLSLGVRFAP
jgi:hypothetical protein